MKARAAVKLLKNGVPNRRLRSYIGWLETNIPDWYKLPLIEFGGRVFVQTTEDQAHEADAGRQSVLAPLAVEVVEELEKEGPLGRLQSFSKWVSMDPRIHGGSPIVRRTRIETRDLAELSLRGVSAPDMAERQSLSVDQVKQALAFETQVVAAA
jgi:uncharacterized protein (DUF433 family)